MKLLSLYLSSLTNVGSGNGCGTSRFGQFVPEWTHLSSSQNQLKHSMLRLALLFLTRMVKFLITLFRSNYFLIRILSDFVFCLCLFFLPCRRLLTADYCSSAWPESLPPPACWLRGLASFNRTPTLLINTLLWFLKPQSYRPTKQQKPFQVNALPC